MYKKIIGAMHALNILFQAIYSLGLPIGIGALISYLLTKNGIAESWIWAILLTVGTLMGLYSMVKYLLSAIKNLERLEKENEATRIAAEEKEIRRQALCRDLKEKTTREDNNG